MPVVCVDGFGLFFAVVGAAAGDEHSVALGVVLRFLFLLPPVVCKNTEQRLESDRRESPARHRSEKSLCQKEFTGSVLSLN